MTSDIPFWNGWLGNSIIIKSSELTCLRWTSLICSFKAEIFFLSTFTENKTIRPAIIKNYSATELIAEDKNQSMNENMGEGGQFKIMNIFHLADPTLHWIEIYFLFGRSRIYFRFHSCIFGFLFYPRRFRICVRFLLYLKIVVINFFCQHNASFLFKSFF